MPDVSRERGQIRALSRHSKIAEFMLGPAHDILHHRMASGISLLCASILALIWANSPWSKLYTNFQHTDVSIDIAVFNATRTVQEWVNEGLMAFFFFLVGLEIKKEVLHGELAERKKVIFPGAAAVGGMIFPTIIYVLFNLGQSTISGWAIPMATDIAFAVGIISLFGNKLPSSLRIFILGLAIVDDIGAIIVIAVFYSKSLNIYPLACAFFVVLILLLIRRVGVRKFAPYFILGIILWMLTLNSGIHATISAVILAFMIPSKPIYNHQKFLKESTQSMNHMQSLVNSKQNEALEIELGKLEIMTKETEAPLVRLERNFAPWVNYFVLPVFALLNAGVELSLNLLQGVYIDPVGLGIMSGLVLGKPLGIFLIGFLVVKLGLARLPDNVNWLHILGCGCLAGIGFTMAIFITYLAFTEGKLIDMAKIGILFASIISAVIGTLLLIFLQKKHENI